MTPKRILFISPIPTVPQTAGNRTRVASLAHALIDLGHDLWFFYVKQEQGDDAAMRVEFADRFIAAEWQEPVPPMLTRLKRKILGAISSDVRYALDIDEWYDPRLDDCLHQAHAAHRFDVVVCSYVFFSRALACFGPEVRKIIDTHDAFANRHRQYLDRGERPAWFSTTPEGEATAFNRADLVFAIQDRERSSFSQLTRTPVVTLSHITPVDCLSSDPVVSGRMLFVASDNSINVHGINAFVQDCLGFIREAVPEAHLCLAGTICRAVDDQPGITKLGRVDDLRSVYASAEVIINPVTFNTGLSIKNLEALGYGKPLVTATVGTDGLEDGAGSAYLVADSGPEFVMRCRELLTSRDRRNHLGSAAVNYVTCRNAEISRSLQRAVCAEEFA
jgi:glycosyltransferase involved in cell wall biosynthesis